MPTQIHESQTDGAAPGPAAAEAERVAHAHRLAAAALADMQRLWRAIAHVKAEPSSAASPLLVDIDHFKRFNDSYGHRTGDVVLRLVGRILAENVKGRDTAARFGGEEFAVILAGADLRAAATVARQIGAALSGQRLRLTSGVAQGYGHVTGSAGVGQARPGEGAAALIERADAALYEAKRTGRNRVCVEAAAPDSAVA